MLERGAMLLILDLLRFFLTGEAITESTIASTTQFLSIANGDWNRALLERVGLPSTFLTPIVAPATSPVTVSEVRLPLISLRRFPPAC